ncbi:hypothetical protein [Microbacterium stercoris]|uniref:Uncharacterized protein n=1 Tax=Microbacterium stercoris TaxID=2820289 RepID=A0A939QIV9_9MICO|nr:hypothetical protein [Microbacterium stercoris]MBO3663678.1 hypothetical protein [Microbacterium stercoris]
MSEVFEFDQAVDRIGEEAAFLALGPHAQAARYLAEAHRMLADVRTVMHRLDAGGNDPMLKPSAQRRMRALAVDVARAGLIDARQVSVTAGRLTTQVLAPEAIRGRNIKGALVGPLRDGVTKATTWGVEKWTGSPLVAAMLPSTTAATQATSKAELVARKGQVPARRLDRRTVRRWRAVGLTSGIAAGGGLAAYGAWSLLALFF